MTAHLRPTPPPPTPPAPQPRLAATVIIPVSLDRGPVLRLAVESVLRQTVRDLEVFIIGDGVHEITRQTAHQLVREDARVRFFDHPKHPRRGEPYRHAALQEARGLIVCYLCDRDLYLPHHVEEMQRLLARADLAHSLPFRVLEHDYSVDFAYDLAAPADRATLGRCHLPLPLSLGAHTLAAYHDLAEGWAQTPPGFLTDCYFWSKFARDSRRRLASGFRPTVLNFPRGAHPGWSTAQRLPELTLWSQRIQDPAQVRAIEADVLAAALRDRAARACLLRHRVLIGGQPLGWRQLRRPADRLVEAIKLYFITRPNHPLTGILLRWSQRRRTSKSARV